MVELSAKLIHYKDDSFGVGENHVDYHILVLENEGVERSNESELTIRVPVELVTKFKLNDAKVLDSLRGKHVYVKGYMYDYKAGYTDKRGNPKERRVLNFRTKDLAFEQKA
jgi:hypothetical protein